MTLLLPSPALHLDVWHCPVSCQHHAVHVGHAAAGAEDTVALNTNSHPKLSEGLIDISSIDFVW